MFHQFPISSIYAFPAPRVTNPPAAREALAQASLWAQPSKNAVYIHVPFCLFLCQFCGFVKSAGWRPTDLDAAVEAVVKEISLTVDQLGLRDVPVDAIYFGGGTASVLSASQVALILKHLDKLFAIAGDAELTFEGECLTLSKRNYLAQLAAMGFSRLSYGVQTMDMGAREVLNLKPTLGALQRLHERARPLFEDVAVDFIYGWPGQSIGELERDIEELVLRIEPLSLEVFQFEKLDASPAFLHQLYSAGVEDLTTPQIQEQRTLIGEILCNHEYQSTGYTRFTKSQARLGVAYSDCYYGYENASVLGFGRGAQSFYGGAMWGSSLEPHEYYEALSQNFLPLNAFGSYTWNERETVNWPRRGWIPESVVKQYDKDWYTHKLAKLLTNDFIVHDLTCFRLTAMGESWIPSILDYLLDDTQRKLFERDFSSRYKIRQNIGIAR